MGVWCVGLYSNDFAQDLRGSVKAIARLLLIPTGTSIICARWNSRPRMARRILITPFSG